MDGEQRDAPLEVVEPGRAGDHLEHAAGELPARRAVLVHQRLALVVGQREPVLVDVAALRHRVEAPRRLALRRELRPQPGLLQLLGHTLGVLRELGERDVGVDDVEARPRPGRSGAPRSRQRSGPRAMTPRSALWPSMATGTTWSPSASAALTACSTARSPVGVSGAHLREQVSTPWPVARASERSGRSSAMSASVRRGYTARSFMQIVFDDGSAVHELEVVVHDPDATVADLVRALDPTQAHRSLAVDGIAPARRPAARPGRHHARAPRSRSPTTAARRRPSPTRRPADGAARHPARGRRARRRRSRPSCGSGGSAVGRGAPLAGLRSTTVSAHHAELTLDGDGRVTVADRGSRNGTWLDGAPGRGAHPVRPGSVLRLGAVAARSPPRRCDDRPSALADAPHHRGRPRSRSTARPARRRPTARPGRAADRRRRPAPRPTRSASSRSSRPSSWAS